MSPQKIKNTANITNQLQSYIFYDKTRALSGKSCTFAAEFVKKDMQKELVSVIMPTFNCSKHLTASIDSILNQTYHDVELLITDDNSTDEETLSILRRYNEQEERVDVLFLDTNKGPGYSRDKSIERAKDRYIAFCDSDDRWFPNKLERQIAFMTENNCPLSYTSYIMQDDENKDKGITIAPKKVSFSMLKRDNKIGCSTAIYDIQLLGKKYFMPFIRKRQDWGLFLTILRDCKTEACGIQEPLTYYRLRPHSVSSSKFGLVKYNLRIYREVLGFSRFKSYAYFFFLFLPTYFTKILKKKIDSFFYLYRQRKNS